MAGRLADARRGRDLYLRADGLAGRIARPFLALALCTAIAGGNACGQSEPAAMSPAQAARVAAAASAAVLRTIDETAAEDYVLENAIGGNEPLGASERCVMPDNRVSERPSPLANPPYAESSIQQRGRLMRALGAYEAVAVAAAGGAAPSELTLALLEFQRETFALDTVANAHGRGDLFVDEGAAALSGLAAQLRAANDPERIAVITAGNTSVAKLIGVLRTDAAARRQDASAASRRNLALWITYAATAGAGSAPQRAPGHLPACNRPQVPDVSDVPVTPDSAGLPSNIPDSIRSRIDDARARATALDALNPDSYFAAFQALDDAAAHHRGSVADALQQLSRTASAIERDARPLRDAPA